MQNIHKKDWYIGALLFSLTIFFTFGWIAVYQAISLPQASDSWLWPISWFSLGIATLCLMTFSLKERTAVNAAAALAFAPPIFFSQDIRFILFLCIGAGLSMIGLSHMRQDMESNMRIFIRKSMQHGAGMILFAFSFAISSFYYTQIRDASGDELLRKLSLDQTSHAMLTQSLGIMNPEFRKMDQESVTVDQFIMTMQKDQPMANVGTDMPSDTELLQMAGMKPTDPRAPQTLARIKKDFQKNADAINPQKLILEQGRKQLSDIAGHQLSGQEHIADVLSQVIDQRVRTYFQPNMVHGNASILPFILSIILFLTLWSLGAILGIVWRFMTAGIFALLRRSDVIEVKKVMVEQEVIE